MVAPGDMAEVDYAAMDGPWTQWQALTGKARVDDVRRTEDGLLIVVPLPVNGFPCGLRVGDIDVAFEPPDRPLSGGCLMRLTLEGEW